MCGFAGFIDLSARLSNGDLDARVRAMADCMVLRGPDGSGTWVDERSGIALGHRRLSVIDLTTHGHQPMSSSSERYVIAYNGEIYNFQDIRRDLECAGVQFCGHSDTEVLLAAIERWGLEATLKRANGMFAFAVWDQHARTLYIARDRFGQKPIYYGFSGSYFVFASELKPIKTLIGNDLKIDRSIVRAYLRHGYVPTPYSIYEGICKLQPGTFLKLTLEDVSSRRMGAPQAYWSALEVAKAGLDRPFEGREDDAVDALDELLCDAVGKCMVSDVPLGAFLSGGIDSSTVVSVMQAQSSRPVKTFSIGFEEAQYNEAAYAGKVARHLKTDHTELYVTEKDALDVLPKLPLLYDEPFADASQIPTYLVSKLARQHVTVSLSGDGGDELFGGYNRYLFANRLDRFDSIMPKPVIGILVDLMRTFSVSAWDRVGSLMPERFKFPQFGDKVHKLASVVDTASPQDRYYALCSIWQNAEDVVCNKEHSPYTLGVPSQWPLLNEHIHQMMYVDAVTYLPDDILTKIDRASMGVSLEARIPLLDHRIYELAWQFALGAKIKGGQGKWPLRQVLHRYVPREIIKRPKMGFGAPIGIWLRKELRDWVESLLATERLRDEGFFDPSIITDTWNEHLRGARNWQYQIWTILMFQAWLDEN